MYFKTNEFKTPERKEIGFGVRDLNSGFYNCGERIRSHVISEENGQTKRLDL